VELEIRQINLRQDQNGGKQHQLEDEKRPAPPFHQVTKDATAPKTMRFAVYRQGTLRFFTFWWVKL
jgi:hypothetical protein